MERWHALFGLRNIQGHNASLEWLCHEGENIVKIRCGTPYK